MDTTEASRLEKKQIIERAFATWANTQPLKGSPRAWDIDPNALTVGGSYSLDSIVMILHKYLIQIKNKIENDINEVDDYLLYAFAKYLVLKYHPIRRPMTEPIKALRELVDDFEYELVMIKV